MAEDKPLNNKDDQPQDDGQATRIQPQADDQQTRVNADDQATRVSQPGETTAGTASPVAQGFPVSIDSRFEFIRPLGSGGTGSTFLAFDQVLQRNVALKFLHHQAGDAQWLMQEARAQAQLKHANICQVFEVGQSQQQVFMVMQYIDGQPLHQVAKQLNREQILLLVQQVCDGLQQAHSQGIVHRDIKPANILVEQQNGRYHASIIDFGLAHYQHQGSTAGHQAGAGTPWYMAPEQFKQDASETDRRVDIYAIGACLFHLLTGKPPQQHTQAGDTQASSTRVATPLTAFAGKPPPPMLKSIPADLQTIVSQCLQPQAKKRYPSAKAVADELGRYLAGEPIKAHKGKGYWLGKKAKKHKWLVGLAAVVVLTLTGSGGWQLYQAQQQQLRESLLQDFTAKVESLEARVRFTQMSPQQNIDGEIALWQQQIAAIEQDILQLGDIAAGPGHYAIGRMYYALQDYSKARQHLQQAWQSGFQQPRAAYIFGMILSELYQQQALQALNIESDKRRQARLQELDNTLRQPAMEYLQQGASDSQYSDYTLAAAAYLQQDYTTASQVLQQSQDLPPWFYERLRLLAASQLQQAENAYNSGDKALGNQLYQQALASAEQGLAIAPNAMALHNIKGTVLLRQVVNKTYGEGDATGLIEQGLAAARKAAGVNSHNLSNQLLLADFQFRELEYLLANKDQQLGTANQASIQALQQALALWPGQPQLLRFLGSAYTRAYEIAVRQGEFDQQAVDNALAAFNAIDPAYRDSRHYVALGKLLLKVAKERQNFGLPRGDYYQQAFAAFEQAKKQGLEKPGSYINFAAAMLNLAEADFNPESEALLLRAEQELKTAFTYPNLAFAAHYYLARVYRALAEWHLNIGRNPNNDIQQSIEHARLATELKSDSYFAHDQLIKSAVFEQINSAKINELNLEEILHFTEGIFVRFSEHSYAGVNIASRLTVLADELSDVEISKSSLLKKGKYYLEEGKEVGSEQSFRLGNAQWLFVSYLVGKEREMTNLTSAWQLMQEFGSNTDDWSANLQGRIALQLALASSDKKSQWFMQSLQYHQQAIALKPYQRRYYQQIECVLLKAKELQVVLESTEAPQPPAEIAPLIQRGVCIDQ